MTQFQLSIKEELITKAELLVKSALSEIKKMKRDIKLATSLQTCQITF